MKTSYLVALAAIFLLTVSPGAVVAEGHFYLAGSIGSASLRDDFDGFRVDTDSTSYRLVGGRQFNDFFSLEFGYHNFGEFEQRFDDGGTPLNIGLKADGFTLGLTGTLPIGENFGLFARGGYFFWDGDAEINNVSQARPEDTNPYLGVGAKFMLAERLTLVGDWTKYQLDDTFSDVVSVGLSYNF